MTIRIATIVPTLHLPMTEGEQYKMSLAHLAHDPAYAGYFSFKGRQKPQGTFVIMDNGVIEVGVPYEGSKLFDAYLKILPDEVILPDYSTDPEKTFDMALETLGEWTEESEGRGIPMPNFMYVPHGNTPDEWIASVNKAVVELPANVTTIGISRLIIPRLFASRTEALKAVPFLLESKKEIHLLGCPGSPVEIWDVEEAFPHRIRGVDSGIAAIYTQANVMMSSGKPKPNVELHFDQFLDPTRLWANILTWVSQVRGHRMTDLK